MSDRLTSILSELQERIQSLCEKDSIGEGEFLDLSGVVQNAYNCIEVAEDDAGRAGAFQVGFSLLITNPGMSHYRQLSHFLNDEQFCKGLVSIKVDDLRIERGDPKSGPELTDSEIFQLERWGNQLVDGAMNSWRTRFNEFDWPPARGEASHNDSDLYCVPQQFQQLICNLVSMHLDLWPRIASWLKRLCIRGPNIFPMPVRHDIEAVMACEPRLVSFVAGAEHLDITELSRLGPILRSDKARKGRELDALNEEQRKLMRKGILFIQENWNGIFRKQVPRHHWGASHYKYPRSESVQRGDYISTGDYFWL
tara:strand:+ start:1591 stop:2520 length:930 start_codon:yes stop_codon:yes gene_type:complete